MSIINSVKRSPIVIALDFTSAEQALAFADDIDPAKARLKVGKELFTYAGPNLVRELHQRGFDVFLDLKFHDIPNTVASAVAAAADLGVWMVNVHASGGRRMLTAASERLVKGNYCTLLTAVTVLTSMEASDLLEIGITQSPESQVIALADLTSSCGLDGVVCSAHEASMLRERFGKDFVLVTPGIRPADHPSDDQRRIMTPAQAMAAGSSYLVIGRPITQAKNPSTALAAICAELI